jgi:hypothetical protein
MESNSQQRKAANSLAEINLQTGAPIAAASYCISSVAISTTHVVVSDPSPPRLAILRQATRSAKCFDTVSAKPWSPTRAIFACWGEKPKDRLCYTVGLSKTGSDVLKNSEADPSPRIQRMVKGQSIRARSGWHIHGIRIGDSGYSNPRTALKTSHPVLTK